MKFVGSSIHARKDYELLKDSEVKDKKIIYCWFASWKTLLAFLTHPTYKKVVVVGGYEVSDINGYGLLSSWKTSWIPKLIFKMADKIFPVCDGIYDEILKLGVKKEKVVLIYDCVDEKFKNYHKKRIYDYITVMNTNKKNWKIKGLDLLIKFASESPKKKFLLIGNQFFNEFPKNIKHIKKIPQKSVIKYYNISKTYLCPSRREGFAKACMEAFICGCHIKFINGIYPKKFLEKYSRKKIIQILSEKRRKIKLIENLKKI